jgi:hypothetical protein
MQWSLSEAPKCHRLCGAALLCIAGELRTLTDVEDFQRWSSCDGLIRRIGAGFHFPLLMLNALDDPLVPHYLTQYCRLLPTRTLVRSAAWHCVRSSAVLPQLLTFHCMARGACAIERRRGSGRRSMRS